MTEQELQAIRIIIREEIAPIKADIVELKKGQEEMRVDIADLKEKQEDIQTSVNAILGWTDKVSEAVNFPLPRI